ncbi:hemolysin family protein [Candidatus Latescibacterota bacterium]
MGALVLYLFFALSISFLCSLLESVLLSVSYAYIALLIKNGRRSGRMLNQMKKNINYPLAAILTLNTVANVVGAAGVGTQSYLLFGKEWVAFVSGALTFLILVFSEIIPKTLGHIYWKTIAPYAAYIIKFLIIITFPIVVFLEFISRSITRKKHLEIITREEIKVLAEIGRKEGILIEKESRIIKNLLLLREMQVEDILTPRAVTLAFQKDQTVEEILSDNPTIQFSRIPIYDSNFDEIVGFVHQKELLKEFYTGQKTKKLEKLLNPIFAVPESKSIADLLDEFISRQEHIFHVVDEYGGTAGIVTLEDAIETLLGVEIVDEFDSVEDMRLHALEKWKNRNSGK